MGYLTETKTSKAKYSITCHAHGHIEVSMKGYKHLYKNDKYKAFIVCRYHNPKSYEFDDAEELSYKRVIQIQQNITDDRLCNIETDVAELKTDVAKLTKNIESMFTMIKEIHINISTLKKE